jgi:hypothetical protein
MTDVYFNQRLQDLERRKLIFEGKILIHSCLQACTAICDYALATLQKRLETPTPETAFRHLPVEDFVKRVEAVKREFTNSTRSKELVRQYAQELGLDPNDYYFDVPRLRVVPNYDYLHAGVSYAYAPHRDTWYGSPSYQINHWMPVLPITPDQTMAIYPTYFTRPVQNSSSGFDLTHWVNVERIKAAQNISKEERKHPLPLEEIDPTSALRLAGDKGDMLVFSGVHLHGTVPNRTATTRFSVDFRLFHIDDIDGRCTLSPPPNVDCQAVSEDYGMSSCFHLGDFSPFGSRN